MSIKESLPIAANSLTKEFNDPLFILEENPRESSRDINLLIQKLTTHNYSLLEKLRNTEHENYILKMLVLTLIFSILFLAVWLV